MCSPYITPWNKECIIKNKFIPASVNFLSEIFNPSVCKKTVELYHYLVIAGYQN